MSQVSVRYIVNDVKPAVEFYTGNFDFKVEMNPGTGFAMLSRGGLRLLLNEPGAGGAGHNADDGSVPQPGGWNRFQLEFDSLEDKVAKMKKSGVVFRTDIVENQGRKQAVAEDPSGNLVEMFQPKRDS